MKEETGKSDYSFLTLESYLYGARPGRGTEAAPGAI